jgi:hypothetical protein
MGTYSFGKLPAKTRPGVLHLADYLNETQLPTPPDAYDVMPRVYQAVGSTDPSQVVPMDGNDANGDCVMAMIAHYSTIVNALAGKTLIPPSADVLAAYYAQTGGQDTGLIEDDALAYWQNSGFFGEKILARVYIDPTKINHLKLAAWLFGGVCMGFQVQQNCISDFDTGIPWTAGPSTGDGHAVLLTSYTATGVAVATWGAIQPAQNSWLTMLDEAHIVLPAEAQLPNFCPGFAYQQLLADAQALADPEPGQGKG